MPEPARRSRRPLASATVPAAQADEPVAAPRGRRRRSGLAEHFARTRELIGAGSDDDDVVAGSRTLLRRHVDDVVDEVYRRLLAHPETAVQFADGRGALGDANGGVTGANVEMRRETFRQWLLSVIDGPLDAQMSEYVATVGHAHARPREASSGHIKAGFLLITMSWVQGLFLSILAEGCSDTAELARQAGAWCRRLMLHLDLLLAVYGSTERSAHWY
jgi:protoglobin